MAETVETGTRHQPNKSEITAARLQFIKTLAGRKRKFNAAALQKLGALNNMTTQTAVSWIHLLVKARIVKRVNHRQWIMLPSSRDQQITQMSKALGVAEFTSLAESPAEIRRKLLAERRIIEKTEKKKVVIIEDRKKEALERVKQLAGDREKLRRYNKLVAALGLDLINQVLGE